MKRLLACISGFAMLSAAPAVAADIVMPPPVYDPPPVMSPVSVYDWTGFYAGVNAGYGWGTANVNPGFGGAADSMSPSGWFAGGQVGYNHVWDNVLLGVEADMQWSNIGDTVNCVAQVNCFFTATITHDVNWFGTVRGRVGLPMDRFLPYVTGGLAFGSVERSNGTSTASNTQTGWVAGAGVEWAQTNNLSWKLEYQYLDFGSANFTLPPAGVVNVSTKMHTVRVGLNYHF